MCTAISYKTNQHYFGRNLDLERNYGEQVVITPRNYAFQQRNGFSLYNHYAMIGMTTVVADYPLYYEATNEKGLSIAGLNFPQNTVYYELIDDKDNIAPFELIPWLLGQCASITEVVQLLDKINIAKIAFSDELPLTPLHWLISDEEASITVECLAEGMKIYENPYGALTNNPPFSYHMMNLNNYMGLHEGAATNCLSPSNILENYSLGMGAMGLPGDYSSASRFVKTVFVKEKSVLGNDETESVNQFFHILSSVSMPKGCVITPNGEYEYTRYTSCCNTDTGVYYYTTYDNRNIISIDMYSVDLDAKNLYCFGSIS